MGRSLRPHYDHLQIWLLTLSCISVFPRLAELRIRILSLLQLGVAHTHSEFATAWAQACRPIPCFGTTHADYFYGAIPVTAKLTPVEIADAYEKNTGLAICKRFDELG